MVIKTLQIIEILSTLVNVILNNTWWLPGNGLCALLINFSVTVHHGIKSYYDIIIKYIMIKYHSKAAKL